MTEKVKRFSLRSPVLDRYPNPLSTGVGVEVVEEETEYPRSGPRSVRAGRRTSRWGTDPETEPRYRPRPGRSQDDSCHWCCLNGDSRCLGLLKRTGEIGRDLDQSPGCLEMRSFREKTGFDRPRLKVVLVPRGCQCTGRSEIPFDLR